MGEWKSKNHSKCLLQQHYRIGNMKDVLPPPYIIGKMERILELEKELSEKG